MPLDVYSLCPGGTGKRVKFCCQDFLGQLQHIERMLEGDQQLACLRHIERLQQQTPDRACLLAIKAPLLRLAGRTDELRATVAVFLQKYPENPMALAESAMLAADEEDGRTAMEALQRAMDACHDGIESQVYEAMGAVARALLHQGQVLAGRALLLLQTALCREDTRPLELAMQLNASPDVPLLIKDDTPLVECPHDAPFQEEFREAMAPVARGQWRTAAQRLAGLAERVGDWPAVWRNLATLGGWLADTPGCIRALRKFAAMEVPLEDAVEAESLALLMSDDPLGDQVDVLTARYPLKNMEQVQAALDCSSQAVAIAFDTAGMGSETAPPPKAVYFLLDRPLSQQGRQLTCDQVPRMLAQVLLFGRETDREARLEVAAVSARRWDSLHALLGELAGESLSNGFTREVIGRISASRELLRPDWRLPEELSPEEARRTVLQLQRDVLLSQWPQLALGLFGGKSAREAAGQPDCRAKVLAAIMLLEFWAEQSGATLDFNQLRSELGLPTLPAIDPEQTPLNQLPLVRLSRVEVEKLSDESLLAAFRRAAAFRATAALKKFALAMIDRPGLTGSDELLTAYRILARIEEDSGLALEHIDRGRRAAESAGQSSAPWDLLELSLRMERAEAEEFSRLMDHLQSQHLREPGVAAALTQVLVQIGAIRPDGTPAAPPAPEEPSIIVPGAPGGEPGKLWTPGSQEPGRQSPKLWTPN